jgi:trehalose 6-phosphate phosphatase
LTAAAAALPAALRGLDALLFDLDGVVTRTAAVHAEAWKRLFDEHLAAREARGEPAVAPFDPGEDYRAHVDGRPREDGVRGFLAARGIVLPEGEPGDGPGRETVHGLGRRKNDCFRELLLARGVESFPSTVSLARVARQAGLRVAVVTSSRNGAAVLTAAGLDEAFDLLVDGNDIARLGLRGKPAPDLFLEATRRLQVSPARTAVFEDARVGVEAAHAGGFAVIVGIDRAGQAAELRRAGAHLVVADLDELAREPPGEAVRRPAGIDGLPSPLASPGSLDGVLRGRRPALFLDYDGTLSPIAARPEEARLPAPTRRVLSALAALCPVAIVSGRARADVESLVGLEGIVYAGCHGFDIAGPGITPPRHPDAERALPTIAFLAAALRAKLGGIDGVLVEDKRYSVAVHTRRVAPGREDEVRAEVVAHAARHPAVRLTGGKKVLELQPRADWDKGRAVLWLLGALRLDRPDVVPIYMGDDQTDEDAFRALAGIGVGIVVGGGEGRDARVSWADYALADTREALLFLQALQGALAPVAR